MKIFDASSVICIFSEISFPKILDVCIKMGYTIAVPSPVYDELKKNKNTWEKFRAFSRFDVIDDFDKDEYERLLNRYPGLHPGEISVICCGLQMTRDGKRHYCIIDETPARKLVHPGLDKPDDKVLYIIAYRYSAKEEYHAGSKTVSNQLERCRTPRVGIACSSVFYRTAKSYPSADCFAGC